MSTSILTIICLLVQFSISQAELKFVQIWFRHGERLPTHYLQISKEEKNNFDYLKLAYPGELTNRGILEEYELGKRLREIYGDHFGEIYRPTDFHVYTGKDNRTSTSAQAMFAGFFPPTKSQQWKSDLNWMPIAQETDASIDWVSLGSFENCPVYGATFEQSEEYLGAMKNLENSDAELVELLRNNTGSSIETAKEYNHIIDSLKIRVIIENDSFPVPKWAKGYEDRILRAGYNIHNVVVGMQNETVGNYHVELVMSYFESYFLSNQTKGIFISGHDTNIMAIWEAFQLTTHPDDIPFFGAHLAIELHEEENEFFVKFILAMGFNQTRHELFPKLCGGKNGCAWNDLQNITMKSRKPRADWALECKGIEKVREPVSTITGSIIVLLSILLLSTIILGFTTFSYKRQLNNMRDPERIRLLQ